MLSCFAVYLPHSRAFVSGWTDANCPFKYVKTVAVATSLGFTFAPAIWESTVLALRKTAPARIRTPTALLFAFTPVS